MNSNYVKNGYIVCECIVDAINNNRALPKKCEAAQDVENRISFLKAHNLITLLDFTIAKADILSFLTQDKAKTLSDTVNKAVYKQLKYDLMSDSISDALSESDIRHIVLKGTEFKKYYPENMVRTSNDIDIYVDKQDLESAGKVLKDNGFVYDKTYNDTEFSYKKEPRYYIELHANLEGFSERQKEILTIFTDNALNVSKKRYSLSDNDFYIYSLFHLYKHFVLSGVGVRMFLDVYMIRKNTPLDFEYITPILKELCIDGFESVVTEINSCLFEGQKASKDLGEVIEFIFDSGAFGKVSSHRHLRKVNAKVLYQNKLDRAKIEYGISFMDMKKRYPILERFPILYPFSFVYRFIFGLFNKSDVLKAAHDSKKSVDKDRVKKYERIFRTLKLNIKN